MRILHTADWHLGKMVNDFSMLEGQSYYLNALIETLKTKEIDAIIMAGDLYDRSLPPKEAVALANTILTRMIKELQVPVFVIAGNHDSNERVEYGSLLLADSQLYIEGTVKKETRKISLNGTNFYLLPFADHVFIRELLQDDSIKNIEDATRMQIEAIKATMDPDEVNILIAHGYIIDYAQDTSETSDSERPLSIGTAEYVNVHLFDDFDYVALGHLHKAQKVSSDKVRYSGSILKYSKSETAHKKQVSIVTIDKSGVAIEPLYIKPLRDMRIVRGTFAECMKGQSDDYLFFELEDTEYVMDAMNQLRLRYPQAMGLEYVTQRQAETVSLQHNQEDLQRATLPELFKDFYEQYRNLELDEEAFKVVSDAFAAVERDE
ncbi:nuclease sbccd subunit d [Trichococcus palustris]|jgi:DNA repair protein SbcD/Mre11|uniref:Nuclease SbcCD subunit D n=1 Tax=Trichococcus palustris TaxID=140314 RepID=A0A143Y3U9_9LACT|nr:exonuclease SbcCD subunit D [Trichococcus palustris]CZQ80103.1 nuclease sbccd subunit d [Trichococcus palustris]SFL08641.1 Exodeoxyribonuclease I subunit D [Trichococcus palustris]